MPQTRERLNLPAIIAIFASGFGIGVGLCGLDYLLASHGIGKSTEEFGVGPLDGVSLFVMSLSALGLVITVIVWIASSLYERFAKRQKSSLYSLFDDDSNADDEDK
jgi:hypothetical protein